MTDIGIAEELFAEEAILKKLNKAHKDKVEAAKQVAIDNGTPLRSKFFGLKSGGIDLIEGKEPEPFVKYALEDYQKAIDWMDETKPETDSFATANLEMFCKWWFENTGEQIPGFAVYEGMTEGKPISARFIVRDVDGVINKIRETEGLPERVVGGLLGGERLMLGGGAHD